MRHSAIHVCGLSFFKHEVCIQASRLIRLAFISSFLGIKRLRIFLFPLDRMPVYRRLLPSSCWYPFILLGGERQVKSSVLPKDTIHGQQLDSNPGPSDLKLQTLTTAPRTSTKVDNKTTNFLKYLPVQL